MMRSIDQLTIVCVKPLRTAEFLGTLGTLGTLLSHILLFVFRLLGAKKNRGPNAVPVSYESASSIGVGCVECARNV